MSKYKRLEKIASLINKDESVLDVGTDHGLVPIFLLRDETTEKITASDINEEPLQAARTNLAEQGVSDKVELILTDGLNNIEPDNYDVIVIAGMGGQTISEIIKSKQYDGRYIIHSTTSLPLVRKTIQEIGMKIVNEYLVIEGKIYNILIEVIPGDMELTDKELYMGPSLINNNDDEVIKYYRFLLDVLEDNATMSGNDQLKLQERTWLKEKIWSE